MVPMYGRCRLFSVWLILVSVSCQSEKETERDYPLPVTRVSNITSQGVLLECTVEGVLTGIAQYGFIWSVSIVLDLNNGDMATYNGIPDNGYFVHETNASLVPGTPYYARAFIESDGLVIYGNMVTFTLPRPVAAFPETWNR